MSCYAVIGSFGNSRPLRTEAIVPFEIHDDWRVRLFEKIEFHLQNTFIESSQSEFIFNIADIVKNTINTVTIENSLRYLQSYLGFKFPNPEEVIDYLQKHRNIYDITLYACTLTEEKFGTRAQISLELYKDPEIDDQYLTIYVRQVEYEPDILEKIETICKEYAPSMDGEHGYVLVTTDFQPPLV